MKWLTLKDELRDIHLRKPRVLTPLRSLRVRNEVELVPLACEDEGHILMLQCTFAVTCKHICEVSFKHSIN